MRRGEKGAYGLFLAVSPAPEAVRETAKRILSGEEYDISPGQERSNWFWDSVRWIFEKIGDLLEKLMPSSVPGGGVVTWIIFGVLTLILVALMVHIVYTLYRAMRPRKESAVEDAIEESHDVDELVDEAGRRAENGDYVGASRMLFRAALVRLEAERGGRVQQGLTNNEYIRTFRAPWVVENLKVFAELINWKWYRDRQFEAEDYDQCRAAYERLDLRLREET